MREYYAPEISSIEQWGESRWRELNTRRYQVFHDSSPPLPPVSLSLSPSAVALSERWNSRYNVSRQVIIRISNREIAIYSWRAGHGAKRGRKAASESGRERERERKTGEDWRADVTIWPPRIHYGQNYRVITAASCQDARAGYIQMQTNAGVFLV